jgi:uncharacterized protein (TIGR02246 family)
LGITLNFFISMNKPMLILLALASSAFLALPPARAADDEQEIRAMIDRYEIAFQAKDVLTVMTFYAPGDQVTAFDIVPPLEKTGHDAYRKNFEGFFAGYEGPLQTEVRNLMVMASGDVAFLTCLERFSGVLKGGQKSDMWCRVTSGLRKIGGKWLIVHDHLSVPVDFETGKALLELKP